MISKHVECEVVNDNYRRLANYINSDQEADKVLHSWFAGCATEDDYDIAVSEVVATQAMNTTAKEEKTYHLLVSFRPQDATTLTPTIFQEIEARFAATLGLAGHQRHCGAHQNTDNPHLHVAYNLIHPTTHNRIEPYRDYWKRDKLCRQLEQEYGLQVDNGVEQKKENRMSDRAASMEAFSGQQSFAGYVLERKTAIIAALEQAKSWGQAHIVLARYGLQIKSRGNGLIIADINKPKLAMKASDVDRGLSLANLQKRFGAYHRVNTNYAAQESYQAKPLQRSPLFEEYLKLRDEKRALAASIRAEKQKQLADSQSKWAREKDKLPLLALTKRDRYELKIFIQQKERAARQNILQMARKKQQELQARFPYKSWQDFYHHHQPREQELQRKPEPQAQREQERPIAVKPIQHQPDIGLSR